MVLVSLFILWLVNWLVGGSNDSVSRLVYCLGG